MTDQPRRPPRQMFAVRVGAAGLNALAVIAADRKAAGRKDCRVSDVARDALAEYAAKHYRPSSDRARPARSTDATPPVPT